MLPVNFLLFEWTYSFQVQKLWLCFYLLSMTYSLDLELRAEIKKEQWYKMSSHIILQAEVLDEGALKRMILQFEKKVYRNQEMRIKYPDLPEK